ncbi:MAG: DUF58 domain-containing protein [Vicinamibacteria bacterium]
MAQGLFDRALRASRLARLVSRLYRDRLTARGRYVLWLSAPLAFVGLDTQQALVYFLFALAAAPWLVAGALALRGRPRVALEAAVPSRVTAGRPAPVRVTVSATGARPSGALVVGSRAGGSAGIRYQPDDLFLSCAPGEAGLGLLEVAAPERGRFSLPALGVGRTDPLGLLATRRVARPGQVVLAYPRFFEMPELSLPPGRRYQPGGIPLASSLGDATEFVGTRDYRDGDPLRRIHWRSWARRGRPVVKEYHEEYFSRVALVLDTYLPRRARHEDRRAFEAAISLVASIADRLSRSEEVVDVLAAGPDLYEVSAGRSLGYLGNVLDVLACLEPCHRPPFTLLSAPLADRLSRLTTVVAVVLDWDEPRERFLQNVRQLGVAVRTYLVRTGATARPERDAAAGLDPVTRITPAEIERRVADAESSLAERAPAPGAFA